MLTQTFLSCALLAGQYAGAASLPQRHKSPSIQAFTVTKTVSLTTYGAPVSTTTKKPRKTVTRTSTEVVYEALSSAGVNPINGFPAPTASKMSSTETSSTSTKTKIKAKVCSGQGITYECANATAQPSAFETKAFSTTTKIANGVVITPLTKTIVGGRETFVPVSI